MSLNDQFSVDGTVIPHHQPSLVEEVDSRQHFDAINFCGLVIRFIPHKYATVVCVLVRKSIGLVCSAQRPLV